MQGQGREGDPRPQACGIAGAVPRWQSFATFFLCLLSLLLIISRLHCHPISCGICSWTLRGCSHLPLPFALNQGLLQGRGFPGGKKSLGSRYHISHFHFPAEWLQMKLLPHSPASHSVETWCRYEGKLGLCTRRAAALAGDYRHT